MRQRQQSRDGGMLRRDAPWNRFQRLIAAALVAPVSGVGCASVPGATPAAPRAAQAEQTEQQLDDLREEDPSPTLDGPTEILAALSAYRRSSPAVLAGARAQEGFSSFKVVDGVPEYRIGIGDVLRITSYVGPEEPTQQMLRVQSDGTVLVPRFRIGRVEVAGLSPTEASNRIGERYAQYAEGIFVDVEVAEYRAWVATLLGEIQLGGSGDHSLEGRTTVVEFIYDHGGPTERANLSDVQLIRGGEQRSLDLLAAMLRGRQEQNPVLDAGDVVFVPSRAVGAGRVFVLGEVANPGDQTFTEGLRFLDAVAQAGAFTQFANLEEAYVTRYEAGAPRLIPVNAERLMTTGDPAINVALQQGDIIVVPRRRNVSQLLRDLLSVSTLVISILTIISVR